MFQLMVNKTPFEHSLYSSQCLEQATSIWLSFFMGTNLFTVPVGVVSSEVAVAEFQKWCINLLF